MSAQFTRIIKNSTTLDLSINILKGGHRGGGGGTFAPPP